MPADTLQAILEPTLTLALAPWLIQLLVVVFVAISVIMILVVLIQKPQGGGLSGAFGASADGAGATALGVKTGDVLTTITVAVFIVFLGFAVMLNFATRPQDPAAATNPTVQQAPEEPPAQQPTTADTDDDPAETPAQQTPPPDLNTPPGEQLPQSDDDTP